MRIFKKNIKHLAKTPFLLSLLFSLALLFRSMALSMASFDFWSDDAIYVSMARYLLEGDFKKIFHPMWPPFYPIATSFIFLFIRSWAYASRIVSLLTGSLLV